MRMTGNVVCQVVMTIACWFHAENARLKAENSTARQPVSGSPCRLITPLSFYINTSSTTSESPTFVSRLDQTRSRSSCLKQLGKRAFRAHS